ncbi:MAG: FlxA-like family protein [Clostridia bacterium]|jgi:hypothetical protein|nr:FlxA-like family protein [Clostridia bacterium]
MLITNGIGVNSANFSKTQNKNNINQDSCLKSIQKQIEDVQKKLQNLADNDKMSPQEKMVMQKELQQQLQDLNKQAAQRRMAIMQENSAKLTDNSQANSATGKKEVQNYDVIENSTMQGLINAGVSMKQASTAHSVKTNLDGKVNTLKSEIQFNSAMGKSTDIKESELADTNARVNIASSNMISKLSDSNKKIENAKDNDESRDNEDDQYSVNQKNYLTNSEYEKHTEKNDDANNKSQNNYQIYSNKEKGQYINIKL